MRDVKKLLTELRGSLTERGDSAKLRKLVDKIYTAAENLSDAKKMSADFMFSDELVADLDAMAKRATRLADSIRVESPPV